MAKALVRESAKKFLSEATEAFDSLTKDDQEFVQPQEEDLVVLQVTCTIIEAEDLLAGDSTGYSDPYISACLKEVDGKKVAGTKFRSTTKKQTLNPKWDEFVDNRVWEFSMAPGQTVAMQVMDEDNIGADENLGSVGIDYAYLLKIQGKDKDEVYWFDVGKNHGTIKKGRLRLGLVVRSKTLSQSLLKEDTLLHLIAENLGMPDVTKVQVSFWELRTVTELHNMQINPDELKREFQTCDKDGNGILQHAELVELLTRLKVRTKIKEVFLRIAGDEDAFLTPEKFAEWLTKEQCEPTTVKKAIQIIKKFEIKETPENYLFSIGFQNYVLSISNDLLNDVHNKPDKLDQPISHYFINSSHNTYLLRAQIGNTSGNCSADAYESALKRGCRCVELDCWDSRGTVVITHGGAFTGQIKFRDAIQTIDTYAFKASQYPIILSLEVHCKDEGKNKMAKIMQEIFGDKIATVEDMQKNCTPEGLKGKIILKGGGKDGSELSRLIGLPSQKFAPANRDPWEYHAENGKHWWVTSFDETTATKMSETEKTKYLTFNTRQLSRIYPKGSRVDSSNYDPSPFWAVGCQVVALNYQTSSTPMYVNEGFFNQNAGCGYVLKPKAMIESPAKWIKSLEKRWIYTVRVIDGWRPVNKKSLLSAIDPAGLPSLSVTVSVNGPAGEFSNTTGVIKNNGHNPIWDEVFKYEVAGPDVTSLLFTVNNEKSKDSFVGYYSICLGAALTGFRRIPLKDSKGLVLPDASLFVFVDRELKPDPNRKIKKMEKQLKATEKQNEALGKRVDSLEKRLAQLEASLNAKKQ